MTVYHTVTGNVRTLAGVAPGRGVRVMVISSIPKPGLIVDNDNGRILVGDMKIDVDLATGDFTIPNLVDYNDVGTDPFHIRYMVLISYTVTSAQGTSIDATWDSGWLMVTTDGDLTDAAYLPAQYAPPEFQSDFIAQALRILAEQVAASDIATSDDVVEALVKNTGGVGPKTSAAVDSAVDDAVAAQSAAAFGLFLSAGLTTSTVQAAVDAATANGGGIVVLPPGQGDFTSQVLVTHSDVHIRGAGRGLTTIRTTYASGGDARVAAFSFKGSVPAFASPTAALTANATVPGSAVTWDAARTIAVDHTTGLAAGDIVLVGDNNTEYTWSNTGWTNRYRGEFARIESVTTNTITFATPMRSPYATGSSAGVWKPTLLANVGISDLSATCDDPTTHDAGAAYFDLCQRVEVRSVAAFGLGTWGFKVDRSYGVHVDDVYASDLRDVGNAQGYGVIFQGTEAGRLSNSRFYRCRHGFTTGAITGHVGWTRNTLVENCVSTDCTNTGFDCHPWTTDLAFVGCRAERNVNGGFALRGQRCSVIACSTSYNNAAGVSVFLQAAKKCTVKGLISHSDVNGVSIASNGGGDGAPSDTAIVGCEIFDARLPGIFLDAYAGTITNTRIDGNTIVNPHHGGGSADTYAAIRVQSTGGAGSITGTVVINNHGVLCNRVLSVPTLMTGTIEDGNRLSQATGTSPTPIIVESGAALATNPYKRILDPGGSTGEVLTRQSDGSWKAAGAPSAVPVSPGIVVPIISGNPRADALAGAPGARAARGNRVRVPVSGKSLRSFSYCVGVSSGNVIGFIMDVGEAASGVYTKLWDSGSVAVGAANNWQNLGDPDLAVTTGQELVFWIVFDNGTASYGRSTNAVVGIHDTATFPVPAGIADAILTFSTTLASFAAPATLAHSAGLGGNTTAPQIVARLA